MLDKNLQFMFIVDCSFDYFLITFLFTILFFIILILSVLGIELFQVPKLEHYVATYF